MARRAPSRSRAFRLRRNRGPWRPLSVLALVAVLGWSAWFGWHRWSAARPKPKRRATASGVEPAKPKPAAPNKIAVATDLIRPTEPPPSPAKEDAKPSPLPVLSGTDPLAAQLALNAHGISSGPLDGVGGAQTASALRAFQMQQGLEQTGWLDRDTLRELKSDREMLTTVTVSEADLAGLAPTPKTWLGKSQLGRLGYETLLELVSEQNHAHPNLVRRLNPSIDWENVVAGTSIVVPDAAYPPARRANLVRVSLGQRWIRAFDARGNLLAHFPCSIGRIAEKRPVGELHVAVAVKDPNYTFDPAVFPESAEGRALGRKLVIPPGPNNPVGVAWIGLDRPGYGIHGTPGPEQVGRTESHGCFRLANWNAEYLRQMVNVGTPVWIEP